MGCFGSLIKVHIYLLKNENGGKILSKSKTNNKKTQKTNRQKMSPQDSTLYLLPTHDRPSHNEGWGGSLARFMYVDCELACGIKYMFAPMFCHPSHVQVPSRVHK